MVNFKLIPYTIRIEHEDEKDYLQLDDLKGVKREFIYEYKRTNPQKSHPIFTEEQIEELKKTDIIHIIKKYFDTIIDPYISEEYMKTISLEKIEDDDRHLFGIIRGGEFGIRADHLNTITKGRIKDARKKTDSEELPFFFHIFIPNDAVEGYVIFESIGIHGVAMQFESHLNEYLKTMKYSISISRMVSQNFLEQINSSDLKEISLIKKTVPKDIADKVHTGESSDITEKITFKAKRNKKISLPNALFKMLENNEVSQYEFLNDHFSEIKAVIKQQKMHRTATFGINAARMGELMYLGDIRLYKDHPEYESIKERSLQYMNDLQYR